MHLLKQWNIGGSFVTGRILCNKGGRGAFQILLLCLCSVLHRESSNCHHTQQQTPSPAPGNTTPSYKLGEENMKKIRFALSRRSPTTRISRLTPTKFLQLKGKQQADDHIRRMGTRIESAYIISISCISVTVASQVFFLTVH